MAEAVSSWTIRTSIVRLVGGGWCQGLEKGSKLSVAVRGERGGACATTKAAPPPTQWRLWYPPQRAAAQTTVLCTMMRCTGFSFGLLFDDRTETYKIHLCACRNLLALLILLLLVLLPPPNRRQKPFYHAAISASTFKRKTEEKT